MFSNMTRIANGLPPKPGETSAEGGADGKSGNVWSEILQEVKAQDNVALPSDRSVVVLGDNESGKTTMIAKLQGNEDPRKGSGLEYAYIDVRDEYRDDQTRLNVWILDGEAQYQHLLQFALTEKSVENTLVVLTVSMTKPWQILDALQTWATVLQDHLDKLNLDVKTVRRLQRRVATRWREYVEPGDELEATQNLAASMTSSMIKTSDVSDGRGDKKGENGVEDDDDDTFGDEQLPDGVLTRNLGLDVIVVVTKTDYMGHLEKEDYRDEHFDFIQQAVRKFCLQYGAALFYTSVKDDKNCDLLYKYLVHRIYGLQFRTPALVVEKDAIFVPAGWDNAKKIGILYENMHSVNPDDYYTDVIAKPAPRKIGGGQRELEVTAEDDQGFLGKHQQAASTAPIGAANAAGASNSPSPSGMKATASPSPMAIQKTGSDRRSSGGVQMSTPKKLDTSGSANMTSEGVLANFFNSLLSKKPPTPSSAGGSTSAASSLRLQDKITSRADAAAELDRLAAQSKRSLSNQESPSGPTSSTDC